MYLPQSIVILLYPAAYHSVNSTWQNIRTICAQYPDYICSLHVLETINHRTHTDDMLWPRQHTISHTATLLYIARKLLFYTRHRQNSIINHERVPLHPPYWYDNPLNITSSVFPVIGSFIYTIRTTNVTFVIQNGRSTRTNQHIWAQRPPEHARM
jgi:hypothetical protein